MLQVREFVYKKTGRDKKILEIFLNGKKFYVLGSVN